MEAGYAAALALAIVAAACTSQEDRMSAVICASLLAASWLLYNAPWHGWGIRVMLHKTVSNSEAWSMGDAVIACGVLTVYKLHRRQWVILIFAMLLGQIACYQALDQFGDASWLAVQGVLDALFLAMVAVLLTVGGMGVGNYLHRGDRIRGIRVLRRQD